MITTHDREKRLNELSVIKTPFTRAKKSARQAKFLPVPVPPGDSLGTPKILSTGATFTFGADTFTR